jgi:hypothetical protein
MKKSNVGCAFLSSAFLIMLLFGRAYSQAPGCRVEGVAMDWNYAVIPGLEVELVGPEKHKTRSGADGSFKFTDIPDGEYLLRPGWHYASEYWRPVYKMRKLRISPSQGHRLQHIDLVLKPKSN